MEEATESCDVKGCRRDAVTQVAGVILDGQEFIVHRCHEHEQQARAEE